MASVEQAQAPVGEAFAVSQVAAHEAVRARHPVRGVARLRDEDVARSRRRAPARPPRRHRRTAPSRCGASEAAKRFCGPNPRHGSSTTRAPARRATSRVASSLPESTTTISSTNDSERRHGASCSPVLYVMRTADSGNGRRAWRLSVDGPVGRSLARRVGPSTTDGRSPGVRRAESIGSPARDCVTQQSGSVIAARRHERVPRTRGATRIR